MIKAGKLRILTLKSFISNFMINGLERIKNKAVKIKESQQQVETFQEIT